MRCVCAHEKETVIQLVMPPLRAFSLRRSLRVRRVRDSLPPHAHGARDKAGRPSFCPLGSLCF